MRCILHAVIVASVLLSLGTHSFKVGQQQQQQQPQQQPPHHHHHLQQQQQQRHTGSGFDREVPLSGGGAGFVASEEAARDFVAHFVNKDNLGIIFSADLRVTGFYKNRENGKILPAEESGMIRIGDRILSVNGAPIATLKELKAAMAAASVPVHIKFRPPAGKDDDRHQKTCRDFRFNITIYSSIMPMISLTTDELIVLEAGLYRRIEPRACVVGVVFFGGAALGGVAARQLAT